jgi:ankyrin repeat protein
MKEHSELMILINNEEFERAIKLTKNNKKILNEYYSDYVYQPILSKDGLQIDSHDYIRSLDAYDIHPAHHVIGKIKSAQNIFYLASTCTLLGLLGKMSPPKDMFLMTDVDLNKLKQQMSGLRKGDPMPKYIVGNDDIAEKNYVGLDIAIKMAEQIGTIESFDCFQSHNPNALSTVVEEPQQILSYAAQHGLTRAVSYALKKGANVNARGKYGYTALMASARCDIVGSGAKDTTVILIDNGADIEARNMNNDTALTLTIRFRHPDITVLLIAAGANIRAENNYGIDALPYCNKIIKDKKLVGDCINYLVISYGQHPLKFMKSIQNLQKAGAEIDQNKVKDFLDIRTRRQDGIVSNFTKILEIDPIMAKYALKFEPIINARDLGLSPNSCFDMFFGKFTCKEKMRRLLKPSRQELVF